MTDSLDGTIGSVQGVDPLSTDPLPSDPGPRPPLGRGYLTVWFGQTVSAIGSMLSGVGIGVWVFLETGSAAWLGLLIALANAPSVLLMPVVRLVDRYPRRRVMIVGDSIAALAALAPLTLALAGKLDVWHLAIAGFVGGAGGAIQYPAFQAAIPSLVAPDAIARANGLHQFGPALGVTVGPLLAAPLVGWWGVESVLIVDLATFVVAVVTTLVIPFGDRPTASDDLPDDGSWRTAWSWLRGPGRALLALIGTMAAVNLVLAGFNIATFALAVELGGTTGAGLPIAVGGVAMIAGSLLIGARGIPRRRIRAFAWGLGVFGIGCGIGAMRPDLWLLTIGVSVALAAVPAVNASVSTIFHERVPDSMQGRVFGIRIAAGQSLGPIGSILAGAMIAGVASPAMEPDAWAGRTIGRVIGDGSERGPALLMIAIAAALGVLAVRLGTSRLVGEIDEPIAGRDSGSRDAAPVGGDLPDEPTGDGHDPDHHREHAVADGRRPIG